MECWETCELRRTTRANPMETNRINTAAYKRTLFFSRQVVSYWQYENQPNGNERTIKSAYSGCEGMKLNVMCSSPYLQCHQYIVSSLGQYTEPDNMEASVTHTLAVQTKSIWVVPSKPNPTCWWNWNMPRTEIPIIFTAVGRVISWLLLYQGMATRASETNRYVLKEECTVSLNTSSNLDGQ